MQDSLTIPKQGIDSIKIRYKPIMDGNHRDTLSFETNEIIVGKPAPEKIMEYAQVLGMILLLSLLVFANANDIIRLF